MAVVNPPAFLQNAGTTHTGEITRGIVNALTGGKLTTSSLKARGGVNFDLGDALLVVQNGSPNMSVNVGTGLALVPGSQGAKQGVYAVTNDASVNLVVGASDPTLNRIDLICFKVEDTAYSGGVNSSSLVVVAGTPAGSPSAPAAPNNSLTLAQISIPAASTTVITARITDRRKFLAAAGGTIRCLSTDRPASTEVSDGQEIFETNTGSTFKWRSATATWQWIGPCGNTAGISTTTASETVSSATLIDMGSPSSFSFTKLATNTRIMVALSSSHYVSTGTAVLELAVNINGVDKIVGNWNVSSTDRRQWNGSVIFSAADVPTAAVHTVKARWRDAGGSGNPGHATGDDWMTMVATEISP